MSVDNALPYKSPLNLTYRKVPNFLDTRNCCNSPKIQTKRPNLKVFCQEHANKIANSEEPKSSLIWVCTICPDLSVRKFRKSRTKLHTLNIR